MTLSNDEATILGFLAWLTEDRQFRICEENHDTDPEQQWEPTYKSNAEIAADYFSARLPPAQPKKERPLGKIQHAALDALVRHGSWYPNCGWNWNNYSGTLRLLESLVARGLAEKEAPRGVYPQHVIYRPTAAGREQVAKQRTRNHAS